MHETSVLHETPSRLRVRLPALAAPGFQAGWLESWLEAMPGVRDVRINTRAASVAVGFDPERIDRDAVMRRLAEFRPDLAPEGVGQASLAGEVAPMVTSAGTSRSCPS